MSVVVVFLISSAAFAGWPFGKKLDLNLLPGHYKYVPTPDTSIDCPEAITVTYDPKTRSVDSELFHFENIGGKSQSLGGLEGTPDHAGYTEKWFETKLTSDSIVEATWDHAARVDVPPLVPNLGGGPQPLMPYDIQDSYAGLITRLRFNAKTGYLKLSTTFENKPLMNPPTCTYQKDR